MCEWYLHCVWFSANFNANSIWLIIKGYNLIFHPYGATIHVKLTPSNETHFNKENAGLHNDIALLQSALFDYWIHFFAFSKSGLRPSKEYKYFIIYKGVFYLQCHSLKWTEQEDRGNILLNSAIPEWKGSHEILISRESKLEIKLDRRYQSSKAALCNYDVFQSKWGTCWSIPNMRQLFNISAFSDRYL